MRKTPLILAAGALAALIIGDVIEVRFHPDKLAGIPAAITSAAKDGSLYEKSRAQFIALRRAADRFLIKDSKQRYEIALKYVEQDSARLEQQKTPTQAKLLEQSLERLSEQSQSLSPEDLSALKEKTTLALSTAQKTLSALEDIEAAYENVKSRFAQVKEAIEKQVGQLNVAGISTQEPPPQNDQIPLKF